MSNIKKILIAVCILFLNISINAQICWEQAEFISNTNDTNTIEVIDIEYSNLFENYRIIVGMHLDGNPYIVALNEQGEFDTTYNTTGGVLFDFAENLELIDFDLNVITGEVFALLRDAENFYTVKLDEDGLINTDFGELGYAILPALNELDLNINDIRIHNGISVNLTGVFNIPDEESAIGMFKYDLNTGIAVDDTPLQIVSTIVDVLNQNNPTGNFIEYVNRIDEKLFFTVNDQNNNRSFGYVRFNENGEIAEDDFAVFDNNVEYTFTNGVYHFPYEPLMTESNEFIRHGSVSLNMAIAIREENIGAIYLKRNLNDSVTTFTKRNYCLPGNISYLDFEIGDHNWNDDFRQLYFAGTQNGNSFLASSSDDQLCYLDNNFISSNPKHIKLYNKVSTSNVDSILLFEEHLDGDFQFNYRLNLYERPTSSESDCLLITSVNNQIQADDFELNVFPNPTNGTEVTVSFSANKPDFIAFNLYNMVGKNLQTYNVDEVVVGAKSNINIELPKYLEKGIYVLQLQQNQAIVSKKIMVQ